MKMQICTMMHTLLQNCLAKYVIWNWLDMPWAIKSKSYLLYIVLEFCVVSIIKYFASFFVIRWTISKPHTSNLKFTILYFIKLYLIFYINLVIFENQGLHYIHRAYYLFIDLIFAISLHKKIKKILKSSTFKLYDKIVCILLYLLCIFFPYIMLVRQQMKYWFQVHTKRPQVQ